MSTQPTEPPVVRRPGKRPNGSGREQHRAFRVSDELWLAARDVAHARGVTLAALLRQALEDIVESDRRAQ